MAIRKERNKHLTDDQRLALEAALRACHARFPLQKRAKRGNVRAKGRRPKAKTCRQTPEKSGLCRPSVAPAHLLFQSTPETRLYPIGPFSVTATVRLGGE